MRILFLLVTVLVTSLLNDSRFNLTFDDTLYALELPQHGYLMGDLSPDGQYVVGTVVTYDLDEDPLDSLIMTWELDLSNPDDEEVVTLPPFSIYPLGTLSLPSLLEYSISPDSTLMAFAENNGSVLTILEFPSLDEYLEIDFSEIGQIRSLTWADSTNEIGVVTLLENETRRSFVRLNPITGEILETRVSDTYTQLDFTQAGWLLWASPIITYEFALCREIFADCTVYKSEGHIGNPHRFNTPFLSTVRTDEDSRIIDSIVWELSATQRLIHQALLDVDLTASVFSPAGTFVAVELTGKVYETQTGEVFNKIDEAQRFTWTSYDDYFVSTDPNLPDTGGITLWQVDETTPISQIGFDRFIAPDFSEDILPHIPGSLFTIK